MVKVLKAREIGPAVMGGRISDVSFDPEDPATFYLGHATGGVAKTTNNGATFSAVFRDEPVHSIGAVAVAPSNAKIVWVGSGEGNDRNSSGWGDGVYRSTDSGATWTNVGLKSSRAIARLLVHPKDPDTAWVCALGDLWQWGGERGLYKTTDGGKSWSAALQGPADMRGRVGCASVAMDPSDPNVLYAGLYARIRTPWSFTYGAAATDGKDLGGIYKSNDGGATWRKLESGLPRRLGNLGLDVSASNPRIVMAVLQSDEGGQGSIDDVRSRSGGGVYRSEDGGDTWTKVSPLNPRPFYFSTIRIAPDNPSLVYVLGFTLHVSEDGGKSWREDLAGKVHPDHHALSFDPRNPKRILLGTDGGAYQSFDRAKSWEHLNRYAAGQFYRISLDDSVPYRICGGLQDNLNWVGPSQVRSKEGIRNSDWISLGGGDGFSCVFDSDDPNVIYTESQQGYLFRMDLRSGLSKTLRPEPGEGQMGFRFHWNAPLIGSAHEKGVIYLGGNRVFRLTERAERWQAISPDLSTQDPKRIASVGSGAERYGVVYTIAESPLRKGLLWAGTDDGKVWITENGGESWTDLSDKLPASARGLWMGRIEASPHDAATAFLAVETHRSGRYEAIALVTRDLGKTWQSIAGDLPSGQPVKVIREDPRRAGLLYAGTEFGLWASADGGRDWMKLGGLPTVPVDDIKIHPRDGDLVAATHGRSLYVIDDLTPLRDLTAEVAAKDAWLFPPRPAFGFIPLDGFADWNGKAVYRGENPKEGAIFNFWIREFTGEEAKIEIKGPGGEPVAKLTAPATPGINRVVWNLKASKDYLSEYGGEGADLLVRPGTYTATLTYGKAKSEQRLEVSMEKGLETR
jgi:photosystem II stability/assembly factor-like uncharacterized protein